MNEIARLIKKPCTFARTIPYTAHSYNHVIDIWKAFKNGQSLPLDISQIFHMHLSNINHIILYNSKDLDNSLLLCYINGRFINTVIPNYSLDKSCVAVWVSA